MQLAVWSHIGGNSEDSPDAISPKSIKKDLLHKANVNEKDLTEEENKEINNRVDKIFEKVNLTEKESEVPTPEQPKEPEEPKQPKKPEEPGQPGNAEDPGQPRIPGEPGTPTETPGDGPHETVCIPEYTTFHCNEEGFQDMCTTEEATIPCPAEEDTTGQQPNSTPVGYLEGASKPVCDGSCTWRLWKVMRVSVKKDITEKEWDEH